MQSRAFDFHLGERKCWAQSHPGKYPLVTLALCTGATPTSLDIAVSMTAAQAHAMAVALEAAATHAENTLPGGLGESEAA
jgi:hypothetical protein